MTEHKLSPGSKVNIDYSDGSEKHATVIAVGGEMVEVKVNGTNEHLFMMVKPDGHGGFKLKPKTRTLSCITI